MRNEIHFALDRVAEEQRGLFTSRQAVGVGIESHNHWYYVKVGRWKRVHRGIYRLRHFSFEPYSEYVLWALWSCNRAGEQQGVYSHETALEFYKLSDLSPSKLVMTVPHSFRRKSKIPDVLILRKAKLCPGDWSMIEGFRVTTPVRTLRDIICSKEVSDEFISQAVREGYLRGLYPEDELRRHGLLGVLGKYI